MLGILISLLLIVCNSFANNTDWAQQDLHFMHDAIGDHHPGMYIESDQQLQTEIEAAVTAEFGSYDNQSPLFAKAVEHACDFYDTTNCDMAGACTFAVQALRHAHNVMQIDVFYYITGASVIFFGQSPEQALALITIHANNNKEDDEVDMDAYPEIKNMVIQKTGSSQESKRYITHAINFVKMGITLQEIDSLTTLIASSSISRDIDSIDEAYYLYFTTRRYLNETHKNALRFVKRCLDLVNHNYDWAIEDLESMRNAIIENRI